MLSAEGMKRGNTSGFMALKNQPRWDSLAVCCLCPSELAAALCAEMLPGADRIPAGLIKPTAGKTPWKLSNTAFPVLKHELCQCLEPTPGFGGVEFPGHTQSSSDRELRWHNVTVGAPTAGHSWGTSHSWALPQAPVCWRTHGNGTSLCKPPQSNHIIKKHRSSF